MVHDKTPQSGQADDMFGSNSGTAKKSKMPYGDDNDFDLASYYNPSPGNVADMLGQNQFSSALYNQQKSGIGILGSRGLGPQQPFGRSLSIPGGHVTPTSGDNNATSNQNRGILPMNRNSLGGGQMPTSQIGNSLLGNRTGLPSPTRAMSSKDLFAMKQQPGNRGLNAAISKNHSFSSQLGQKYFEAAIQDLFQDRCKWRNAFALSPSCQPQTTNCTGMNNSKKDRMMLPQSMSVSAIGSESLAQLRQQQTLPVSSQIGQSITASGLNAFNLDQSDFPALAQRTKPIGSQPTSSGGSKPYVGMVSKQSDNNEFQIHNEDFPALPGAAAMNVMKAVFPDQDGRGDESSNKFNPLGSLQIGGQADKANQKSSSSEHQKGIQILPDNTIKNIPNSMLTDQYGIVGLFAFIKAAETDPTLVHLALGNDLTTLGLNLNSPDNLYHKFQSPFSRQPCRLQDIDFFVPSEYLTNTHIRDKLAPIKLNRYGEDLLFFVYYSNSGDVLQLAAAAELYNRDWRFHKEERIWITRMPGIEPGVKTSTYEQGTYYYFDCQNWRKVAKEFHLEYEKLEERPHLSNLISLHFNPAQHG